MIPAFVDTHSEDIYTIPIADDGSALQAVSERTYWRVRPAYFTQNIDGAIPTCYLRPDVISRLAKVAIDIRTHTPWQLLILDGWRPTAVQQALYEDIYRQISTAYPDLTQAQWQQHTLEFVALPSNNPLRPSPHLTGGSVDLTLCDENGQAIDMGSAFDEPSTRSYSDAYENQPSTIRERRRLLYQAMINAGFTNLPTEWWHFDYGNQNWAYYSGNTHAIFGAVYPNS